MRYMLSLTLLLSLSAEAPPPAAGDELAERGPATQRVFGAPRGGGRRSAKDPASLAGLKAHRAPAQSSRGRIRRLLSGYEAIPTVEALVGSGSPEEAVAELAALATSPGAPTWLRARAAAKLGAFEGAEARQTLLRLVGRPEVWSTPSAGASGAILVTRAAALALGQRGSSAPRLARLLHHPEPALRSAAAGALAAAPDPQVRLQLEAAAQRETIPHVAAQMRRALDERRSLRK